MVSVIAAPAMLGARYVIPETMAARSDKIGRVSSESGVMRVAGPQMRRYEQPLAPVHVVMEDDHDSQWREPADGRPARLSMPKNRKVGGSTPPLATTESAGRRWWGNYRRVWPAAMPG